MSDNLKNKIQYKQPRAFYYLFFTELWERFSFYGMRALLILYMTKQLMFSDSQSYGILGAYMGLVYAFGVLGGYLSDNFLGNRRAILFGGILITIGHITLSVPFDDSLFYGLSLLIVGTGFFKPSISSFLGKFYHKNDIRRDSGFTYFYMGINIGSFFAPLLCGTIGQSETFGWHYGFGLAAIGMIFGLIVFYRGYSQFGNKGLPINEESVDKKILFNLSINNIIILGSIIAIFLVVSLLKQQDSVIGLFLYWV